MEYAIIQSGGKQYKATVGRILEIDKINAESGNTHTFESVLLYVNDGDSKIGHPLLNDISVTGKILDQIKGEKIRVAKFKAKARYRRVQGHRQQLTRVQITGISTKTALKTEKRKEEPAEEKSKRITRKPKS
jgi:large subunit ribosomal protein L21